VSQKHSKHYEASSIIRASFYAFVVELTGKWALENEKVLECIADMARYKLPPSRIEFYIRNLRRQISLGHAQRISSAVLAMIAQYKPFLPRPQLLLYDVYDIIGRPPQSFILYLT
jgi:hypothetical protein